MVILFVVIVKGSEKPLLKKKQIMCMVRDRGELSVIRNVCSSCFYRTARLNISQLVILFRKMRLLSVSR